MASFKEHVGFSGLLGVGYGLGATFLLGFSPTQGALAGYLAGVGGMLPDLDSPTGKPGQEIFSLTAAVAPLVLIGNVLKWAKLPTDTETVMLTMLLMYFAIRYGAAWFVAKLSVHRGMFHSIPANVIAAEVTYLFYPTESIVVKWLMAGAIAVGFFSHLLLDEIYSITWSGAMPRLKKSSGTAIKFWGKEFGPSAFTYVMLMFLTFVTLEDAGVISTTRELQASPAEEEIDGESPETLLPNSVESRAVQEARHIRDELSDAPKFQ
ncbi:metal-dependent hydrolase [Thalassoglobus sp.]|uniref:metal-dependent hydrolase n=1 Tax=Thalassoglobus sp. TaxID=2795869 RepID=UPI003AA911D1